jgi:hypothetical protein
MRDNHRTLTDVGQKVQIASGRFSETERRNSEDVSRIADA